jgi:hypothetical protein
MLDAAISLLFLLCGIMLSVCYVIFIFILIQSEAKMTQMLRNMPHLSDDADLTEDVINFDDTPVTPATGSGLAKSGSGKCAVIFTH